MVRRTDSALRWSLIAAAVAYVALVFAVDAVGGSGLVILIATWLGSLVVLSVAIVRFPAHQYTAPGFLGFLVSMLVFQAWSAVAFWVAILTSVRGLEAMVIQASAVLPLCAGVYWVSRAAKTVS